jgi:hypothetical protein
MQCDPLQRWRSKSQRIGAALLDTLHSVLHCAANTLQPVAPCCNMPRGVATCRDALQRAGAPSALLSLQRIQCSATATGPGETTLVWADAHFNTSGSVRGGGCGRAWSPLLRRAAEGVGTGADKPERGGAIQRTDEADLLALRRLLDIHVDVTAGTGTGTHMRTHRRTHKRAVLRLKATRSCGPTAHYGLTHWSGHCERYSAIPRPAEAIGSGVANGGAHGSVNVEGRVATLARRAAP